MTHVGTNPPTEAARDEHSDDSVFRPIALALGALVVIGALLMVLSMAAASVFS